ncbi:hypothetical protein CW745_12920 [Psychromonas sp. psych-6C06]|uniref:hypothetical protein n=1 Tax=Psychromonas sp. psych-6C06 TaxID=2058089 RepID=UPI000C32D454|nr:hypothetical protein [Psychromonas sp. psych-6C06]PKF60772.1 hypothetical protein CW745_12920 [Psychromonas sp. psych-6C06]
MNSYTAIEIPFNFRNTCWFCGEPDDKNICFPRKEYESNIVTHKAIFLPSCKECASIVKRTAFTSVFAYRDAIKQALVKKHQKVLSIGSNWTEQELLESELEGSAFEGFKRSAWPMFKMMQARINYQGWPVVINNDQLIAELDNEQFEFDGIHYPCLNDAVTHAVKTFFLDEELFTRVLSVLGKNKFSQAIRLCRLYPKLTSKQREEVFLEILDSIGL